MLGEEVLDLRHAGTCPIFQPGLGEIVLDAMKAAFTHGGIIGGIPPPAYGPFGSSLRARGPTVAGTVGPALPRSSATSHELARVELLAGLPGQTLGKLAKQMVREEIAPGTAVIREGEPGERFYVVFAGMLTVTNSAMGEREILRPGDYFGEVALAMDVPRTATVTAMTPAVVASCDRATFDELLRPLFADD